jgi:hypothetical protein
MSLRVAQRRSNLGSQTRFIAFGDPIKPARAFEIVSSGLSWPGTARRLALFGAAALVLQASSAPVAACPRIGFVLHGRSLPAGRRPPEIGFVWRHGPSDSPARLGQIGFVCTMAPGSGLGGTHSLAKLALFRTPGPRLRPGARKLALFCAMALRGLGVPARVLPPSRCPGELALFLRRPLGGNSS